MNVEMSLQADFGPDSGGRLKGVTIVKPIVFGNIARYFGKKREEDGHTHQWTVYLKSFNNEDLSTYIKKVHFKLHESYANPNRIITKPPYEVTETGWGEFEIVIKAYFHDPTERPLTIYHILKLFTSTVSDPGANPGPVAPSPQQGLVSESYDEIIFQDPTQLMQHLLIAAKPTANNSLKHDTDFEEKRKKTFQSIVNAKSSVKRDIALLKDKLKLAKETIGKFKTEIAHAKSNAI